MKGSDFSVKKIISIVVSVSLTMHIGLSLYNSDINAADRLTYGVITVSGSDVTLDFTGAGTDSVNFTIDEGDSGGYKITCDYPATEDDAEKEVSSITKLSINTSGDCQINADMESELVLYNEYTSVTIGAGYVFDCTGLTADPAGGINVYGTFIMDDFNSADYAGDSSRVIFNNYGVIAADNMDITDTTYLRNNESSVYRFSNSFVKGEEDFPGKVVATEPDATVTSGGGSFLLEYEGISAMIEGDVDTTVADLLLTATSSYFDFPADNSMNAFYYGVDYDFEPYIVVTPDDYPGTPYVEYAEEDMEMEDEPVFSTTKPEDPGMYIIRIQVPTDGEFAGSTSLYHYFNISFLYIEAALFPDTEDQYVQFDNVVNGSFVNDVLLVSAAPGFEISCPDYDGGAFESQIELYSSDVFDGDEINADTMLAFRRQSTSETTDYFSISEICPEIADITFDEDEPVINLDFVDGQEASLDDGGKVNADQVEFSVWDDTLKEIYINGTLAYDQDDFEEGYQELTFTSTEGEGTEYVIRAVDIFDQESTFGFTLYPPQVDPDLEVTLPDEIFVEQNYDVTINTNSDGEVSIKYYSADSDTPLADKPTTAGSYICAVYVEATDLYNGTGTNVEFEIKRYTGTATITVPQPLYVGDEYNIDIDTESDGEPAITYRYNDEEGQPVSAAQPTAAGNYTVLVSIPQTSTYDEINASEDFSILKRDATATISVPDSHVGETYTPTTSTISNGAASAVIEYKVQGADDRTYTTTQPTAAGDYTARYTVPATDEYLGTFATDDFTISKNTVDVTVSVPDTVYGESYTPTLTTESDGAERAVYEYKVNGAADSTFTTTAPTLPGDYIVRVTVPETDAYNEVSATDTFTISKGTVDATVSVPDTVYGESYTPTLTTDSDGAERAVYEYKVSGAADSTYTTTAPTAPGDYVVRVTVPETDIYNEVTATDDFTISKGTVTATVSVPDTVYGETYTPTLTTVSDGADRAVYEYKADGAEDSTYTTTAPTMPGDYIVRVTVPETDNYNEVSATDAFTIGKLTVDATVSVPDTVYGESYTPTLTTESDGAERAVYEYKVNGAADSTYTTTAPTIPGDYIVRVTVPETDIYNEVTATDSFTIGKGTATATVSVPDTVYGESYTPTLTTVSDGADRAVYEYKADGAADSTYTTTAPTMPGDYIVRVTVPETDNYNEVSATDTFTISRMTAVASVSVPDTVYGETYTPTLTTDSDGADRAVYEYKVSGADDSTFTTTAPTLPGDYIVRVTVPQTDTYNEVSAADSFTIGKGTVPATVTVPDTVYGESYTPTLTTDSDGAERAVYEYKINGAADSTYTTTAPTMPGEYIVRATVPETELYNEVSATGSFTISKVTVTATVSVPDTSYGETYTPTLSTVSDGADRAVYEYKVDGAADSTYTTTAPTVPGEYIVRVTVPETDIYNEVSAADSFTISKGTVAATVSVPDTSYGETYSPTLTTESDGADRAVYEYKVDGAADSTYTTTAPTVPGDYIVRVTVPETDLYNEVSATDSFTISKATATATITVPDSFVGDEYTPVTSTNSDGAARGLIEYKIKGAEDWTYTTAQPFVLGTFTARYTVPETDNYFGVVVTDDFTISRRTATASVSVPDTVYGESYSPTLTTDSDGADRAVYEYKVSGAADNTFTTTAPTMPGDYIVRVTIPQTDNYNEVSATDSFTISKKTPTLTFTVSNSYVGTTYSPSVTTDSNMASSAVIEYKEKAAPDTDYTTTKPTAYGEYIARVIVPASDIYFATSAETEFKISYLESPENAFNFEGTEGNNGYYTSEVELKAPEGYQISSSYNGTYSDSIQYNENIRNIYLKRNSDGALTAAIVLSNRPKIDMAAPEITSTSGSIENGSIHYAQNFEFSATDPNLKSLKINGEEVDLSTLVGNKITLTAGYGFKSFTIIAEDEAGNISKVQFILMAEWLKTRLIPADLKLPLIVSEAYILDDGEWTVNDDATVYVGGGEVYVRQNADYTFTRSN